MDEKFQDRIDDYLLNRMDDTEKAMFLREVEQDEEKKEQLEFTRNVKDSLCSREEKLRALAQFQQQYEEERKGAALRPTGTDCAPCSCPASERETKQMPPKSRKWLWISGVAAVLIVGFFAIKPLFVYESSQNEQIRGGEGVFGSHAPVDSMGNDTVKFDNDTVKFDIEKKIMPDE